MSSLRLFLHKTVGQNQHLGNLLFILSDWFINVFKITRVEDKNSDLFVIYTHKEKFFLSDQIQNTKNLPFVKNAPQKTKQN